MFKSISLNVIFRSLFCQLAINISFVLSVLISLPFFKHQVLTESNTFRRFVSKGHLSKEVLYKVVSSAYKSTAIGEFFNEKGRSFITRKYITVNCHIKDPTSLK